MSEFPRRTTLLALAAACFTKLAGAAERFHSRSKLCNLGGIPKRAYETDRVLESQSLIAIAGVAPPEPTVIGRETRRRKLFNVPQQTLKVKNVVLSNIALAFYEDGYWACTGTLSMPQNAEGEGRLAIVRIIVRAYAGGAQLPLAEFTNQPRLWETKQKYSVKKGQSTAIALMPAAGLEGGSVASHLGGQSDETCLSPGERLSRLCSLHFASMTHVELVLERLQPA
jgi:hypothetical protein